MESDKVLDAGSRFIKLLGERIPTQPGLELATVVTPSPLRIRIDNMSLILEPQDLIICGYLQGTTEAGGIDGHTHQNTSLKAGDRVVVMSFPGGQQYLVFDKVVIP